MTVMLLRPADGARRSSCSTPAPALPLPLPLPPAGKCACVTRAAGPPRRAAAAPPTAAATAAAREAMRYYRIWIYACNAALFVGAVAFIGAAARALADYRRDLIPGLAAAQPGFLYGYAALPAQAGLLQLLGCLAALRLSERLLNAYWLMLLALLLGDAAVGVFWAFRFERLCRELRPSLRARLAADYGADEDFTASWDRLQAEQRCCGALGPADFAAFNKSAEWARAPPSCCRALPALPLVDKNGTVTAPVCAPHATACADRLLTWLRSTADVLFVIGYCVIAFLKVCFIGILRYEIKEMIQKIKILQSEMDPGGALSNEGGGSPAQTLIVGVNGGVRSNSQAAAPGSPEYGEREALLGGPRHSRLIRGRCDDSDANSARALLADEPEGSPAPSAPTFVLPALKNLNGNNNCEMPCDTRI